MQWFELCGFESNKVKIISKPTDLFEITPCMPHTHIVSFPECRVTHSFRLYTHYSHRGRVNHLLSAKLEASLSPPISFFPTWALSDGLAHCTETQLSAAEEPRRTQIKTKKKKKFCRYPLDSNFLAIVPALKGKYHHFSFVQSHFFDFWVESMTPPRSFD